MRIQDQHRSCGSGKSTQTRQRYSVTRTRKRQKRSRSTTSKSRSCQKDTVRDILYKKLRSKIKKLKKSKTDWRQRGQRPTSIDKNWPRKITDYATTSFQHGHHANIDIRKWNVDVITETRKNDQDRATKDASPHCTEKRKYKSRKEAANKTAETKKLKRAQIRTLTKIKTVMCPSKKTLTKHLTLLKNTKIGSNTSREVPQKQKNTWRKWRYLAGLKHTEDWSGEWEVE